MYSLPQEIEVWYVIPAIRRELANFLTKKHGFSYEKAGNALKISKAAISQYRKNKRASKVRLHSRVMKEVEKSSNVISKGNDYSVKEILRVLKFMRDKKIPFEYCKGGKHDHEECNEVTVTYENDWE